MILSPSQQATVRKRPQSTRLWLSIYQPKILFAAQVTGSYSGFGSTNISYYAPSTGTWQNTYPNQQVMIGSTPNSDDIGRLRLRAATGTSVTFAENSFLWQQGQYLTFIDYVDIEAIYPKIIQDPSNAENVIFYKDGDIPYSNQNTIYGSFPCAGIHRAGFVTTGSCSFYFTATGTTNVRGDTMTYSWAFEGGTPTGSTALTPGWVSWSAPGHNKARLIVTSSSGAQDVTYRYISTYNRPEQGTNTPILKWELTDFSGSRSEGGYNLRIRIRENIDSVHPNALVVIFADDMYGTEEVSLGGNAQNSSSIVYAGYILKDSVTFDYRQSSAEFTVGSVSEIMKTAEGFSVSCESKGSPATWFELQEMTVQKALYHYLRWHSTILNTTDFQYTGDDRLVQYFDTDRASLFEAIDGFLKNSLQGELVADRQGKLWAEITELGLEDPINTIPLNPIGIDKQDWMGSPIIDERRVAEVSFVELGGIIYYGVSSNIFAAIISNAPSESPLYHGKPTTNEGMIITSQAQLNQITGNYLANKNTPINNLSIQMNGNYRNLDIAPQERFKFYIDSGDTVKNRNLNNYTFKIQSMDWTYNPQKESFYPNVVFSQLASGTIGETIVIPATVPDNTGFSYPSLHLPPLPKFDSDFSGLPTNTNITRVIIWDVNFGLLLTENFDASLPTWRTINSGLTTGQYQSLNFIGICPNGAIYVGFIDNNWTNDFMFRAPSIGGTFVQQTYPNHLTTFAVDRTSSERVGFLTNTGHLNLATFRVGANNSFSAPGATLSEGFVTSERLTFGDSNWLFTTYDAAYRINSAGSSATPISPGSLQRPHFRAGTTGKTFHNMQTPTTSIKFGTNNLASNTAIDLTPKVIAFDDGGVFNPLLVADCDPTGLYLMARQNGSLVGAKSSDGGYTWSAAMIIAGNWYFRNAGTIGRWVAANATVQYSDNFGGYWAAKTGNLTSIVPFPNIKMIRVIG